MKKPKRKVELLFHGRLEDYTTKDSVAYWQSLSGEQRLNATWELAVDAWLLKGRKKSELRLQRSVALFKRE